MTSHYPSYIANHLLFFDFHALHWRKWRLFYNHKQGCNFGERGAREGTCPPSCPTFQENPKKKEETEKHIMTVSLSIHALSLFFTHAIPKSHEDSTGQILLQWTSRGFQIIPFYWHFIVLYTARNKFKRNILYSNQLKLTSRILYIPSCANTSCHKHGGQWILIFSDTFISRFKGKKGGVTNSK